MGRVLSFAQECERIFERWRAEVKQLLGRQVDRDWAYEAWAAGYSAAEYAAVVAASK